MVRLRAFRAIDDQSSCQKFLDGHIRVLRSIGVTEVSTANQDWFTNPSVYVVIVESMETDKVYGGARVHVADGITPLPVEQATGEMDGKIYDIVKEHSVNGTGEICGLWNSIEVAGQGFGSIFSIRAAVTITSMIGLESIFALCSPFTTRTVTSYSFEVIRSLGNNGTFYYPKSDLVATVMMIKNTLLLENASAHERERIFDLRKNPNQTTVEKAKKNEIEIKYELDIGGIIHQNFHFEKAEVLKI